MKKIITAACCICALSAGAQKNSLLQKLEAANREPDMEYDYMIRLYDMPGKRGLDSTAGHLAVKDGCYLDSNSYAYTARVGDYSFRLDHTRKTAVICNMKTLAKKMGVSLENNESKFLYNISGALLQDGGNLQIDSSDARLYRVKVRLKNHELSFVQMDFWRSGYKLAAAYFEKEYKNTDGHRITAMTIRNVKHQLGENRIDLGKIYTRSNGKVVLSRKYAHYKMVPVN